MSSQCFSLSHELNLRHTQYGPRIYCTPVKEVDTLRVETIVSASDVSIEEAQQLLQACNDELTEVQIDLTKPATINLQINGITANFTGTSARIYNDRVINEVYVDGGREYRVNAKPPEDLTDHATTLSTEGDAKIKSLKVYRLKSIF